MKSNIEKRPVPTSTAEMRQFLLEQMVNIAEGKLEASQAKAICNFAQQIYNTVKLEMAFAQAKNKLDIKQIEAVSWNTNSQSKTKSLRAA
jgi:hypothetical protein